MRDLPRIDMQATGRRIETLRKSKGVTVERLSEMLQLAAPRAIYKWQRGDTLPTLDNLVILAEIFETTLDHIVVKEEKGGDEQSPPSVFIIVPHPVWNSVLFRNPPERSFCR